MEYNALIEIVKNGGGWEKVICLIFDNAIMSMKDQMGGFTKEMFIQLGGSWVFKEPFAVRHKTKGDYSIVLYKYHPLDHLQAVIMGNMEDVDVMSMNDLLHG